MSPHESGPEEMAIPIVPAGPAPGAHHPTVDAAARLALDVANLKRVNAGLSEKLAAIDALHHRMGDLGTREDAEYCADCGQSYPCATAQLAADTAGVSGRGDQQ